MIRIGLSAGCQDRLHITLKNVADGRRLLGFLAEEGARETGIPSG
jgi:hypothetical protein